MGIHVVSCTGLRYWIVDVAFELHSAPAEPAWLASVKELLALAEKKSGMSALRGALTARSWSCGPLVPYDYKSTSSHYFDASAPSDDGCPFTATLAR